MIVRLPRILIVGLLLLAFAPRQVIGMSCCHAPAPHASESSLPAHSCCCHEGDDESDPVTEEKPVRPLPCSDCGIDWCCGTGYVPLTSPHEAVPALDITPESALVYLSLQPSDGYSPRIEEPPRAA